VRAAPAAPPAGAPPAAAAIVSAFQAAPDGKARLRLLLDYARRLPPFPEEFKVAENRVMGCSAQVRGRARRGVGAQVRFGSPTTSSGAGAAALPVHPFPCLRPLRPPFCPPPTPQAWVHASLDAATGAVSFTAASDSDVTSGLAGVLVAALSGLTPAQVLDVDAAWLRGLGLGGAAGALAPSRVNGFSNMLEAMKRRARMLTTELPRFPSLLISGDKLEPQVRVPGGGARSRPRGASQSVQHSGLCRRRQQQQAAAGSPAAAPNLAVPPPTPRARLPRRRRSSCAPTRRRSTASPRRCATSASASSPTFTWTRRCRAC
jgi:cysteine desulfuration protein SufE